MPRTVRTALAAVRRSVRSLRRLGADVITLGNHAFSNYEFLGKIDKLDYVVKPCNVSKSWPGNDIVTMEKNGQKIAVINLLGQINMMPSGNNPFEAADELIDEINDMGIKSILVDFHTETTSEKCATGILPCRQGFRCCRNTYTCADFG